MTTRHRAPARSWALPPDPQRPVRVLFIAGQGRSGTTLLDRMLGQLPFFCSVGEMIHLWAHGLQGERCGCGEAFHNCPFWQKVGARAYGGWDNISAAEIYALQRSVDRSRYIPAMVSPHRSAAFAARLNAYVAHLATVYRAIAESCDGRIIIDSSKQPSVAYLLSRTPGIDLRALLMVRSSHGMAYSWTKLVTKPEVVDRVEHMPRYRPARSAAYWNLYNELFQGLSRLGVPTTVLNYEEVVRSPRAQLEKVVRLVDQPVREADFAWLAGDRVTLGPTHTVSGNPMRFQTGELQLRLDEEWQQRMRRVDRLKVSAVSGPLLRRYGYGFDGKVFRR